MSYLVILGLVILWSSQLQATSNRCDSPRTILLTTPCTSCAASPAVVCPRGFRKTSKNSGTTGCSYMVEIGDRQVELPGCSHKCEKVTTVKRCCPDFWGPLCLPCPSWSGKTCNGYGTCGAGDSGNGTCICEEGYSGFACQNCLNKNAYGEHCRSECSCVNGQCNSGPEGNGECYCQPPYAGPKCDKISSSCSNCPAYSYCKGDVTNAVCECLPGYKKVGHACIGVCSPGICDVNADCSFSSGQFHCKCKEGFEGDGKHCIPKNPCATQNGGCPEDSTICEYTGPGKAKCTCVPGTDSPDPSKGCRPKSACTASSCDSGARCETSSDGTVRCLCNAQQIGDGRRCYGNLMERLVELDREASHSGNLTGSIRLFEQGCEFTLSQHGPFTAFIPVGQNPFQAIAAKASASIMNTVCKNHLILGQRLYKDLEGNDLWTYGGEKVRFKAEKQFILMRDPDVLFTILESDIPASNGIIHIIDKPFTLTHIESSNNMEFSSKTIGEIFREDDRFNRFLSLVDNCGVVLPIRGSGPLTVFVPTNKAIDRSRDGSIIYMLNDAKAKLQTLLKHHMFSLAALTVDQLASMSEINTMANEILPVNVSGDGRVFLGQKGIPLETKDIVASNGIIHLIDGILVPSSIVPIMPHRCDVNESRIIVGPCVRCSYLYETQCPPGSVELENHLRGCEPNPDPRWTFSLSEMGCAKYCNTTQMRAECCSGFYGPDCRPCVGGFQHPCYDKGVCFDGIAGNGSCKCEPAFKGVACHICTDHNKHGENCDEDCRCVHGVCDNRPGSMGVCRRGSCLNDYSGELCDQTATQCDSDGAFMDCHIHAKCVYNGGQTMCACLPGYEGDGYTCTEANLCLKPDRGGCDVNAGCMYEGAGKVNCVCMEGWTGDGTMCTEINNCILDSRGGCHEHAECTHTGPGQNVCSCRKGYMGDGIVCKIVNVCLTNNGGCHSLATCKMNGNGTHDCTCPNEYDGDGITCYGNMLKELDGNSEFYQFNRFLQRHTVIDSDRRVTALVPTKNAFRNLSDSEEDFWLDYYRLPHLLKVHFLDGIYTFEDLKKQVGKTVPTMGKTKWEIQSKGNELMIGNATILVPDLKAINGCIHLIDTILRPPVSDFPPPPPDLMEALNKTPSFSLFRQAALLYNLSENIPTKDYTIFVPYDSAIQEYLKKTNSTQLTQKIMKYHVILSEQLFPEHLGNGIFKNTFLGNGTQIMFYVDSQNRTMANDVPLNGSFIETRNGMLFGIPRVLDIHKNHCSKDVILKIGGRCGDCSEAPKCFYNAKPIQETYPPNMKSNCRYKTKVGKKKKFVPGCHIDCLRTTKDHSCCPGYFGHDCFKCPGTVDNWCSNNGQCQDGLHGNGECLCNEGFHGTACEMCEPGRFGKDCKSECHCEHGKCLDGMEGNGQCICFKGWKGVNCSVEIVNDACGGVCDVNANCISGGSGSPTCSCTAGYSGNGMVCTEIDPCAVNNGGCSSNANCTKTAPGERNCKCINGYTGDGVVCLETDSCLVNNGGCDKNAICLKTGPNKVACACKPGFTSLGHICLATNPCRKNNGGCSLNAICRYIGDGERNCTCYIGYKGDGFQCAGTVSRELLRKPEAEWFRRNLGISKVRDLFSQGPFTVFLPHADYVKNLTNVESWVNKSFSPDMLRYHIVGCEELRESDLMSVKEVLTTGGHKLRFSVRDGVVYINNNTKIITSDFECSNGVIHIIDKVLFPYKLTDNMPEISTDLNVTAAAEQYGFKTFSKLLQDANLMHVVLHRPFYPFTMFWPTDSVFDSLPEERKRWLYSEDHRDKLQAYLKAHIVRDQRTVAGALPAEKKVETLYGTELTFSCNKNLIGDILINGNNARIISRNLLYDFGIAHGIDQLLEPPSIGARCDDFANTEKEGRCGSCILPPRCPLGTEDTNKTNICRRSYMPYIPRRPYGFYSYGLQYDSYRPLIGCNRICTKMEWSFKCCKNHYGRDCQVCPGGLEAPCGEHGDCDDGQMGTGKCKCHQGFRGTACELCQLNHFGPNCTACNCTTNGKCDEGIDGVGSCFCQEGWTGTHCESKIEVKPVCSPTCDLNAVCLPENQCECVPPYEGNGINCTAPDFCSEYNGGCHEQAACLQTGINVSCSCQTGYSGDGHVCSPINRCVEEANGGCSDFAECIFTGPNERRCQCLPGYVGNGVQCLEKVVPPLDRCLENNGGCDPKASCKDLHFHTKTAGVFHFRSPEGKYKLNFSQAQEACESEGGSLATFSQLSDAQQLGMHLCVAGWMDGKKAGYPIRFPSVKCGDNHVGIVVYKEPVNVSWPYDAYCYRMREVSCKCGQGYVGDGEFCNGDLASVVATTSNFSVFYTTLLKYAEDGEEGKNLLNFLSDGSSNTTIFVPHNDGFSANETLSWRDLQYHISTINNIHYFEDMKHNTVIPSRLGSDLVVIISSNSTSQAEESQPQKLVNKKVILAWNIPAINGLIHVIEAPLRAPPVHVAPVLPISQSSGVAVTTVLIIIAIVCIVTGLAYYVLKHKNDAFRFQYFKNDDEDGASRKDGGNPALVSIPNPLYSGYRAFAEPFGESAATDTPNLMD